MTPSHHGAVLQKGNRKEVGRGDIDHPGEEIGAGFEFGFPNRTHLHGKGAAVIVRIAQLAVGGQAPGPNGAVRLEGNGVVLPGGDGYGAGEGRGAGAAAGRTDLHRRGAQGIGAVPKLAVTVVAPGQQGAVGFEG